MMDFHRLKKILLHARQLPAAERDAWLEQICGDDSELLDEARALLAHDSSPEPEVLTPSLAGDALRDALFAGRPPERVGPYRLLELLGEGGMGVVYRARDEGPLEREVAVKFLRFGLSSQTARARFDTERSVLARMDHHGIARVYGAGTDDHGRPWVAMELVKGEPITRWCDARQASIEVRVQLLRDVCVAIQHAHQKGVLHRDLKPSNILVDLYEGQPRARVIDFGIAKGLDAAAGEETLTVAGEFLGTPEYMSPEQAGSDPAHVDTRSDIYSLGVVLQELLVGETPLGEDTRRGKSLPDLLQLLRQRDAEPPSRVLARFPRARQREIADARALRPQQLERKLRGDLSAITHRALEREPDRRYESAAALAADLNRWLRNEPVEAAMPSRVRQFGALVRRHRLVSTAIATGFLVLLAGLTTTLWQARRAAGESAVAEQRLEDIRSFVIELVFEVDQELRDLNGSGELRTLLAERCVEQLGRISEDRNARPQLRRTLADAYRRLGFMQKELGQLDEAMASYASGMELLDEELAAHPDSLQVLRDKAVNFDSRASVQSLRGDDPASLEDAQRALAIFEQLMEVDPTGPRRLYDLSIARSSVAGKLFGLGRMEESIAMRKLGIEGRRALVREDPADISQMSMLAREIRRVGNFHEDSGELELAAPYYEEALALDRRCAAAEPQNRRAAATLAGSLVNFGRYLCYTGRYDEGIALLEESQEMRERLIEENPLELRYVGDLVFTLVSTAEIEMKRDRVDLALEKLAQAEAVAVEALSGHEEIAVLGHNVAWSRQVQGRARMQIADYAAAERSLRTGLEVIPLEITENDLLTSWRRASIQCDLGELFLRRAENAESGRARLVAASSRDWFRTGLGRMEELQAAGQLIQWQLDEVELIQRLSAKADSLYGVLGP